MNIIENQAEDILKKTINNYKSTNNKYFILCDTITEKLCLPILESICETSFSDNLIVINYGEKNKNIDSCMHIWQQLLDKNATRQSILCCLGGGIVCDMGAFVAATFKRGIPYILIPTTLIAQIDAAIGGKSAINFGHIKNQIGLFSSNTETFIISRFLDTLPDKEIYSGFAEMLKHALIADNSYWCKLSNIQDINQIKNINFIKKSIDIKLNICKQDLHEKHERKKLNFGHTIGHALESFSLEHSSVPLSHGHAIAFGIIAESYLSWKNGLINKNQLYNIKQIINKHFTKPNISSTDYNTIFNFIHFDKKRNKNLFNFTLISDIGNAIIDQQIDEQQIFSAINFCLD